MACGTLAALALTGAGTGADIVANNNIRSQSNNDVNQMLAQQQQFQKQASGVFNQSFNNSTPQAAQQQIGQGQQQLGGLINNVQSAPLSLSSPSFGNINTQGQQVRQQNSNQASANLGGYSNYGLQQYLKNLSTNSQLGLISNQAQQAESVLPYQLGQAQQSQQGLQAIGSLLNTGGGLLGLSGLASAPTTGTNYMNYPGTASMLNGIQADSYLPTGNPLSLGLLNNYY